MIDDPKVIEQIRGRLALSHETGVEKGCEIITESLTPIEMALMEFTWAGGFIEGCEHCGMISEETRVMLTKERSELLTFDIRMGGLKFE
jgi:hypothetical protein